MSARWTHGRIHRRKFDVLRLTCNWEVNRVSQIAPGLSYNGTVINLSSLVLDNFSNSVYLHKKFWRNEAAFFFLPGLLYFKISDLFLHAVIAKGVFEKKGVVCWNYPNFSFQTSLSKQQQSKDFHSSDDIRGCHWATRPLLNKHA